MRKCIIAFLLIAFIIVPCIAMAQAPESVCDNEAGAAYGLCNAYCDAMDCDGEPQASQTACDKVASKFLNITGRTMPCEEPVCPCQTVFDDVIANHLQDITTCWNNDNVDVGISNEVGGPGGRYAKANTDTLSCSAQSAYYSGPPVYGTLEEIQKCIDILVPVIEDPAGPCN